MRLVKVVLTTPSGSVEVLGYDRLPTSAGGYVKGGHIGPMLGATQFNHGDKIEVVFVDQLDADERTDEDERQITEVK